jgi:hypothetical protein
VTTTERSDQVDGEPENESGMAPKRTGRSPRAGRAVRGTWVA